MRIPDCLSPRTIWQHSGPVKSASLRLATARLTFRSGYQLERSRAASAHFFCRVLSIREKPSAPEEAARALPSQNRGIARSQSRSGTPGRLQRGNRLGGRSAGRQSGKTWTVPPSRGGRPRFSHCPEDIFLGPCSAGPLGWPHHQSGRATHLVSVALDRYPTHFGVCGRRNGRGLGWRDHGFQHPHRSVRSERNPKICPCRAAIHRRGRCLRFLCGPVPLRRSGKVAREDKPSHQGVRTKGSSMKLASPTA